MYISKNNLDIVAWFIFIRSSHREFVLNKTFKTSIFSKDLLQKILETSLKNLEKDKNSSLYFEFCINVLKSLKNYPNEDIGELLNPYFEKNHSSIDFSDLPFEVEVAIKMVLNLEENGRFFFKKIDAGFCNENFLLDAGFDKDYINELIRVLIGLDDDFYVAICGDGSPDVLKRVKKELEKYSIISYVKAVGVSEKGKRQWVRLQYAHESHWDERNFKNYMHHPHHGLRIPGSSIGLFFFKKKNLHHNIRDLKDSFRNNLEDSFPHVHFPDEHKEVKWMADAAYNENTIDWMNQATETFPENFQILFPEYRKEISNRSDSDSFCLDTGMVLALHDMRDTSDIDFISCGTSEKPIVNHRMESHNLQYNNYNKTPKEIIENPQSHFYYKDVKFCSLNEIKALKLFRADLNTHSMNSKKDLNDVKLIENYINQLDHKKDIPYSKPLEEIPVKELTIHLSFGQRFTKSKIYKILKLSVPLSIRSLLRDKYIDYISKKKEKILSKVPSILG